MDVPAKHSHKNDGQIPILKYFVKQIKFSETKNTGHNLGSISQETNFIPAVKTAEQNPNHL